MGPPKKWGRVYLFEVYREMLTLFIIGIIAINLAFYQIKKD